MYPYISLGCASITPYTTYTTPKIILLFPQAVAGISRVEWTQTLGLDLFGLGLADQLSEVVATVPTSAYCREAATSWRVA